MILGDIDAAGHCLPESADAKLQMISSPAFLLDGEQMTIIAADAAKARF
jgi:hypothetical protein